MYFTFLRFEALTGACTILSYSQQLTHDARLSGFRRFHGLNLDFVSARHTLELDEIVIRAVSGEEGTCVLEVLHLGLALQRFLARIVVPVREEDAPVGCCERVVSRAAGSGVRCNGPKPLPWWCIVHASLSYIFAKTSYLNFLMWHFLNACD